MRSAVAYASTVVAFSIPNSATAFPAAPRAVSAKRRWTTWERLSNQIVRWISASVTHMAEAIDQIIVIQLISGGASYLPCYLEADCFTRLTAASTLRPCRCAGRQGPASDR